MPGIFLRRDEGELVHLHGELYESEDQLQGLLEANPELLLGETARSDRQSKYLLVRREAGVPEADGGSDRWFLDHTAGVTLSNAFFFGDSRLVSPPAGLSVAWLHLDAEF